MRRLSNFRTTLSVLFVPLLLGGCEGEISNVEEEPPIDIAEFCAEAERTPGRVTVRRLSHAEYERTMAALFMRDAEGLAATFPEDSETSSGFLNDADTLSVSPSLLESYHLTAEALAPEAVANQAFLDRYLPCGDASCLDQFVSDFGLHAWRRPLTDAEHSAMTALITDGNGHSFTSRLETGIRAFVMSPNFVFRAEPHIPADEMRHLTGYELATRLSYFLWGAPPDDALYAAAVTAASWILLAWNPRSPECSPTTALAAC